MKLMRFGAPIALAIILLARPAAAQSQSVTSSEIQRLQDAIYDASRDVAQLRSRDSATASQLQAELDDARDETVYLKVKLRKNEPISRSDYADVRDRIDNIRSRARGDSTGAYTPSSGVGIGDDSRTTQPVSTGSGGTAGRSQNPNEIPVGTEFELGG